VAEDGVFVLLIGGRGLVVQLGVAFEDAEFLVVLTDLLAERRDVVGRRGLGPTG
jgi:hypothetical protein